MASFELHIYAGIETKIGPTHLEVSADEGIGGGDWNFLMIFLKISWFREIFEQKRGQ
jgi:hypothetical protein